MFYHLTRFHPAPHLIQICFRPALSIHTRRFSYSHLVSSDLAPEPPSVEEQAEYADATTQSALSQREAQIKEPETYNQFMTVMGEQFRLTTGPKQWLGGDVPFPMNPSFKPPPPVSDAIREYIYNAHMKDPVRNSVRSLSQRFHLSLKRIDAILRLKGMEKDWKQGKILQAGFRDGMEKILGVVQNKEDVLASSWPTEQSRKDTHEADSLEEAEKRDAARQRYQQQYWESVPEAGREPIVPGSLEYAKSAAKRYAEAEEASKSNRKLMPIVKDARTRRPKEKVQIVEKPGRPPMKFTDVGGHFIDVNERLRRIAQSERRAKMKERKAETNNAKTKGRSTITSQRNPLKDSTL